MAFKPFAPILKPPVTPDATGVYPFLEKLTGYIFSIGIALGIIAFLLSIIFFAIAQGDQRFMARSKFWLIFGTVTTSIGGLIWAIYRLTQQFFR